MGDDPETRRGLLREGSGWFPMVITAPGLDDGLVTALEGPGQAGDQGKGPAVTPPQPPPRRPGLARSRHERVIAGVAGGLGQHFGVDPVVVRIGFVLAVLLGGSGLLAYLVAWLVIPEDGAHRSVGEAALRSARRGPVAMILSIALIVVALDLGFHNFGFWPGPGLAVPLLLIGLGAALMWGRTDTGPDTGTLEPEAPAFAPAGTTAPAHDVDRTEEVPPTPPAPPDRPLLPGPPPPPRARRPRSVLGRATLSVILVLAGLAGLIDASDAFDITLEGYLAVALVVAGLGLVVGAWWGRARGLIIVGILLVGALGAARAIDVPLRGGFGERQYTPETVAQLRDEYRLLGGQMRVDLTEVQFPAGVTGLEASVAFGELTVLVPPGVTTTVEAQVDAGNVNLFGREDHGLDVEERALSQGIGTGRSLQLDLHVGAGEIDVQRGPGEIEVRRGPA
jgi:phage shock protein PspC (stress-responsive transcriptional regulator)